MAEVYGPLAPTPGTYAEIEPSEASGTSCGNKEPEQEVTTTSEPYGKTKGDEIAYLKELLAVFKAKDEEAKAESDAKEAKIAKLEEEVRGSRVGLASGKFDRRRGSELPFKYDLTPPPPPLRNTLRTLVTDRHSLIHPTLTALCGQGLDTKESRPPPG